MSIVDKSSQKVVLVIQCLSFVDMVVNEYEEYEKVITLISIIKGASMI